MRKLNFQVSYLVIAMLMTEKPVQIESSLPSDNVISSVGQNVTVVKGENALLQCNVEKITQQVIWRKGIEVLAAGAVLLKIDFRYSVVLGSGFSRLNIQDVRLEDSGEFVCQVQTDSGPEEVMHKLTVQGIILAVDEKVVF